MNILITGGSGYIGSKLVPYLLNHGMNITVIDRLDFNNNLTPHKNLVLKTKDILNTSIEDYKGYDVIIHLAGLSNDPMANFSPNDNFIQNLSTTALAAFYSKQAQIPRFVFASSCSVYGNNVKEFSSEKIKPGADFPYGISKLQAEECLKIMADDTFKIIILRQATVFGWAPRMRTDLVVNTMTKTSILNNKIIVNNENTFRPLIHIDDLCKTYLKIIECGNDAPQLVNVSSENFTLKSIAEEIKDTLQPLIKNLIIENKNIFEPRSYFVDNTLMKFSIGNWDYVDIKTAVLELIDKIPISNIDEWANTDYVNLEMYKKNFKK